MRYKEQDPMRSAFNAPTKRGLHPHLLLSDGKENPQSMYEFENEVFDVLKPQLNQQLNPQQQLNQLKGIDPNNLLNQPKTGGLMQWIKDHPIISIGTALALGAVVANALAKSNQDSTGGEGGDLDSLGDLDFEQATPGRNRKKNPGTVTTSNGDGIQASLAPAQVIISSPPMYQPHQQSPLIPSQIISPVSQSPNKSTQSDGSVIDAEYTQIKTRRRRKPSKVQVRREDGTFTSKTKSVRKQRRDGTGKFQ